MEGRRMSSQLWKDEGSVLEAIDELMAPSSDFSLSDIQDKQEAKSTKEHLYDEEDYKMHRGAGFPHHHQPLKKLHYHRRKSSVPSTSSNQDSPELAAVAETQEPSSPQESKTLEETDEPAAGSDAPQADKTLSAESATSGAALVDPLEGSSKPGKARSVPRIFLSTATSQPEVEIHPDAPPAPPKPKSSDTSLAEKPLKSSLKKPSMTPDDQPLGSYGFFPNIDTRTAEYGKQCSDAPLSSTVRESSLEPNEGEGGQHKVAFILGSDSTEEASPPQPTVPEGAPVSSSKGAQLHRAKDRHHHHHHRHKHRRYIYDPSLMILHDAEEKHRVVTEPEEAMTLQSADLEDMASHRFEDPKGMRRHKILAKNTVLSFLHPTPEDSLDVPAPDSGKRYSVPFMKKLYDRKPHEIFVELDELVPDATREAYEWKETARWIKYEENLEEDVDRWGKPHVASLSFHSLLCLRKCLEQGTVLLDLEEKDLTGIANRVVDNMVHTEQIPAESHGSVLRALLLRHRHGAERSLNTFLRRNSSGTFTALKSLRSASLVSNFTSSSQDNGNAGNRSMPLLTADTRISIDKGSHEENEPFLLGCSTDDLRKPDANILRRIPEDAEATAVLVGGLEYLEQPTIAFVRLARGQVMPNMMEVPIPVRFFFILLGPINSDLDYHEIGRSVSTLMSNTSFHTAAYKAEDRRDLLRAINEFLDDSIVLPPGDWDRKSLLPVDDIKKKYDDIRKRKMSKKKTTLSLEEKLPQYEPLQRSGRLFGGLVSDVKHRLPWYLSDFRDALNGQCLATAIFIYFAALSGAVTFGGLLGDKTSNLIGVSETLVATCATGVLFSLLSGQPLVIIGVTGPVLLFDELLYAFCKENDIEFLAIRVWIGMWIAVLATLVVAFEGSALVRFFTRFTQEIFASLISLLYIYESFYKLYMIFVTHPLLSGNAYCDNSTSDFTGANYSLANYSFSNWTMEDDFILDVPPMRQPNTALLSLILMFSTFFLADFLRKFRNSSFLGRNARRALGDFGIPIAIILVVTVDFFIPNTYSQKLQVPNGLSTSNETRGWIISPVSSTHPFVWWHIFVAAIGALLVFILMFLEIEICELILSKKERKLQKGSGFHLDLLLICYMELGCAFIGAPWMCAATVRSVSHLASLTVMSRTHAPGESPHIIGVKEQRVTNLLVSLLVGLSVFMSPLLREVPVAVLFGVFLYMGITSMIGIQLFERIILFFKPTKHFPSVPYAQKVKATKMHLYTVIQVVCLILLWAVKSSSLALAFPFVLLLMIPLRLQLKYLFTEKELECLDGDDGGLQSDEEDDPDFYQQTILPS
uniref:Anion exchange protein n=3 Tax=Ixodes ricinus TaxID=34613 RepID=A0A147BN19_IXORI